MSVETMIAIAGLVIAIASMLSAAVYRRDRVNAKVIEAMNKTLSARIDKVNNEHELRAARQAKKQADLESNIYRLQLDLANKFASYPTKEHLDDTLERFMRPIELHMAKTESFIEEILRAGVLAKTSVFGNHSRAAPK